MDAQKIYQALVTDAEAMRDSLIAQAQQKNGQIQQIRAALEQAVAELNYISGQAEQANQYAAALKAKMDTHDAPTQEEMILDTWPENS